MDRSELVALIVGTVRDFISATGRAEVAVDEGTPLFGPDALLESIELVNVVLDVEQAVNERLSTSFSLADDRAMSRESSPFRSVGALADYVLKLVAEEGPA